MKKQFEKPDIQVERFDLEDVIAFSLSNIFMPPSMPDNMTDIG